MALDRPEAPTEAHTMEDADRDGSGAGSQSERFPPVVFGYQALSDVLYDGRRSADTLRTRKSQGDWTVPPPSGRTGTRGKAGGRVYWLGSHLEKWLEIWEREGAPPEPGRFLSLIAAAGSGETA